MRDEDELKILRGGVLPSASQIRSDSDVFIVGGNPLLLIKSQAVVKASIGCVNVPRGIHIKRAPLPAWRPAYSRTVTPSWLIQRRKRSP